MSDIHKCENTIDYDACIGILEAVVRLSSYFCKMMPALILHMLQQLGFIACSPDLSLLYNIELMKKCSSVSVKTFGCSCIINLAYFFTPDAIVRYLSGLGISTAIH